MNERTSLASRAPLFLVSAAVVAVDQASKLWAEANLKGQPAIEVIPSLLDFTYSRNSGGLFGAFGDSAPVLRLILLIVLPLVAVGLISWLVLSSPEEDRRSRWGLVLILGGAIGNLIDRVARGEVIDFLDLYVSHGGTADWLRETFGTAHWPTFNVADSAIVVGAGLLLLSIVRPAKPEPQVVESGV